ncbi:MAG: hypothetical protein ABH840_03255 [Nanoarchaeota archaeon]
MAKRIKRAEKGIESLKQEIENHIQKIEKDIEEGNIDRGRYHIKEIDKSLLKALELKMGIAGVENDDILLFRKRLE